MKASWAAWFSYQKRQEDAGGFKDKGDKGFDLSCILLRSLC